MSDLIRKLVESNENILGEFEKKALKEQEQAGNLPKPDAKATTGAKKLEKEPEEKTKEQEKAPANTPVKKAPEQAGDLPNNPAKETTAQKDAKDKSVKEAQEGFEDWFEKNKDSEDLKEQYVIYKSDMASLNEEVESFEEWARARYAVKEQWENLPKGWTQKSLEKFAKSLTHKTKGNPEGFFRTCVVKMEGKVGDPDAFCASLKDKYLGTTKWRKGRASEGTEGEEGQPIEEQGTRNIKVEHPGVLEIPAGKHFWQMPLKHFIDLAKKKGKAAVMRALLNLERWNKNRAKDISKKARDIINRLKANKEYLAIGTVESISKLRELELSRVVLEWYNQNREVLKDIDLFEEVYKKNEELLDEEKDFMFEKLLDITEGLYEDAEEEKEGKEYLGNKAGEKYYYLVKEVDDSGNVTDVKVVDEEDNEVYSVKAKDPEADLTDEIGVLKAVLQNIDMDEVAYEIAMKLLAAEEKEEEEEEKPEEAPEEKPEEAPKPEEEEKPEETPEEETPPTEGKIPNPKGTEKDKIDALVEKDKKDSKEV